MSRRLWAVANATGTSATLTSTEGDRLHIAALGVTHTGGSDGDFVYLSDCSSSDYWPKHHMSIVADDQSWAISCWADDQQGRLFLWSSYNGWSSAHPVPNSQSPVDNCAIMIRSVDNAPVVTWQPW